MYPYYYGLIAFHQSLHLISHPTILFHHNRTTMPQNENLVYNGIGNIKRIVVLMFENRSFDQLFGDFRNVNGLFGEDGNFKPECYNLTQPLQSPTDDNGSNPKQLPVKGDPYTPFPHDFTHDFGDGMMPDLFGPVFTVDETTYTSGYTKDGLVGEKTPNTKTFPDKNSGFITTCNKNSPQGPTVMTYFPKGSMKIMHALADEFVLCDNWHCDMPGHTMVNRCFMHAATTGNLGINDPDSGNNNAPTIFDLINQQANEQENLESPPTWKMYASSSNANERQYHELDTRFLNPEMQQYTGFSLQDFSDDCSKGSLPFYSFLMCWLPGSTSYTDTSMHPVVTTRGGENLLAAVYNTLRQSPCWDDTLLVVNFDENGGIYDHVFPPTTTPPVPGAQPATQFTQGDCGNNWINNATFDFSLLGVRIPALLISPWLGKGVDNNLYQNTSVVRFIIDKMNSLYNTSAEPLTQRDATAPLLDSVFDQFGQAVMREDCPHRIGPWETLPTPDPLTGSTALPYSDGTLSVWTPPAGTAQAKPVEYINEYLNMYISPLPGHADSGKKITRVFATNAEVDEYKQERKAAADVYYTANLKI